MGEKHKKHTNNRIIRYTTLGRVILSLCPALGSILRFAIVLKLTEDDTLASQKNKLISFAFLKQLFLF